MEEPIYEVKPKYHLLCEFLNRNFATTIILLILLVPAIKINMGAFYTVVLIVYIVYLIISHLMTIRKYQISQFSFYKDRVIMTKGSNVTEVFYENLKDVMIYQSTIQKLFNMGEYILQMNNVGFLKNNIRLYGISNIINESEKIREIIYKDKE